MSQIWSRGRSNRIGKTMNIGSTVRVLKSDMNVKLIAGATAKVADPRKSFWQKYLQLCQKFQNDQNSIKEFIWVVWDKDNPMYRNQEDGAYARYRFVTESLPNGDSFDFIIKDDEPAPRNNEGRSKCFWCKKDTVKILILNNTSDFCKGCQK